MTVGLLLATFQFRYHAFHCPGVFAIFVVFCVLCLLVVLRTVSCIVGSLRRAVFDYDITTYILNIGGCPAAHTTSSEYSDRVYYSAV